MRTRSGMVIVANVLVVLVILGVFAYGFYLLDCFSRITDKGSMQK